MSELTSNRGTFTLATLGRQTLASSVLEQDSLEREARGIVPGGGPRRVENIGSEIKR